jgi:hypothetical protein
MATPPDIMQQIIQGSQLGAGIDLPQFQERFLPPQPQVPQAVTAGDPFGQALATLGAGLAQPVQANQSAIGNAANAALAGLDVLNADRQAQNASAQAQFENTLDSQATGVSQANALTNAANANAQAGYYEGLLRQQGVDTQGNLNLEAAKLALDMQRYILEHGPEAYGDEAFQVMYPTGSGIYADAYRMIASGLGVLEVNAALTKKLEDGAAYAGLRTRYATKGLVLPPSYAEYLKAKDEWDAKMTAILAKPEETGEGSGIIDSIVNTATNITDAISGGNTQTNNPSNPNATPSPSLGQAAATRGAAGSSAQGTNPGQFVEDLLAPAIAQPISPLGVQPPNQQNIPGRRGRP